ncbi:MAG: mannose-1-phosphate guanylyltransferase [Paludibacteraceae bacterium]|nr:mannose-1-phosphate guanylyltransferase [Paludibacteraceae bacterium]
MAGGVGSRFWPFSRVDKPKQFLDFFGTGRSLLQMTVDRFRPLVPMENMLIVTNVAYKDMILEQVPGIKESQILCEPARRSTAPCIAYAVSRIRSLCMRKVGLITPQPDWSRQEMKVNIVVAASDHLILDEEGFRKTISHALDFVSENNAILTLGMKPTRPETGYGYIQYLQNQKVERFDDVCKVKTFTEKPNLEMAKVFLRSGDFLWNSGIFIWNLQTISEAFEKYMPEVAEKFRDGEMLMGTDKEDDFIEKIFPTCPNISIDYGVMEKADNVYVLPSDFGWSDLGTWGSLHELSEKDESGNVSLHSNAIFYESEGNVVTLESGKLAVVQGMKDMIVAESNGVLLICQKAEEQRIKQFVTDAENKFGGKFI